MLGPVVLNPLRGVRVVPVAIGSAELVIGIRRVAVVVDGAQGFPRGDIGGAGSGQRRDVVNRRGRGRLRGCDRDGGGGHRRMGDAPIGLCGFGSVIVGLSGRRNRV